MKKKFYRTFASSLALLLPVLGMCQAPTLTNVRCNPNGTLTNGADDYIQFSMQPTPPKATYESPYTYKVSAVQAGNPVAVTLQDGSPATNLLYYSGYAAPLRLANGTSGKGNVTITVTPNWGGYAATSATLTDPGSCASSIVCTPGTKTVTYIYEAYRDLTEADNWQAHIPKFDQTTGKTLTNVSVSLESRTWSRYLMENNAQTSTTVRVSASTNFDYYLSGNSAYSSPTRTVAYTPGTISLPARVLVPATGAWTGDVNESTIQGMNAYGDWLDQSLLLGLSPKDDSRWVTNLTGSAGDDADMFLSAAVGTTDANSLSYTSASTEWTSFIGTGKIPLTYSTLNGLSISGGGGNLVSSQRTTTAFKATVTYSFTDNCTPLPVTLISFDATQSNNQTKLQWVTSFENAFQGFAIERSSDIASWTQLGFVASLSDGSNRTGRTDYSFTDESPVKGVNYYRLKQIDFDGTYKYSTVKAVKIADVTLSVYPNPTSDYFVIKGLTGSEQIGIYDAKGMLVRQVVCTPEETKATLSGLAENVYFVRVTTVNGSMTSYRLIFKK